MKLKTLLILSLGFVTGCSTFTTKRPGISGIKVYSGSTEDGSLVRLQDENDIIRPTDKVFDDYFAVHKNDFFQMLEVMDQCILFKKAQ